MPTKWDKKSEKRGEEKRRKENVNTNVSLLNPIFKFLLSVHARTYHFTSGSEGYEVYNFQLFTARQWPENLSNSMKTHFQQNFQEWMG